MLQTIQIETAPDPTPPSSGCMAGSRLPMTSSPWCRRSWTRRERAWRFVFPQRAGETGHDQRRHSMRAWYDIRASTGSRPKTSPASRDLPGVWELIGREIEAGIPRGQDGACLGISQVRCGFAVYGSAPSRARWPAFWRCRVICRWRHDSAASGPPPMPVRIFHGTRSSTMACCPFSMGRVPVSS